MDMPKTRAGGDHSSRRFDEVIPVFRIRVGFNNPCHRNFLLSVEGGIPPFRSFLFCLWTVHCWNVKREQGWAGMTFGHLGTGTGMAQPIPKLWEREREWKISFPTFGNGNGKIPFPIFGNGNGNSIPAFREREWDIVIPGNDREREWEWHRKIEWKFFRNPI